MPTNKQRRDAARRHLERQLERRAEQEATRRRFAMIASVAGTVVVVGVIVALVVVLGGSGGKGKPAAASTKAATGSASAAASASAPAAPAPGDCTFTKAGKAAKPATIPADGTVPTTGTVTVAVKTNRGPMTFTLDRANAPCTVDSFVSLVDQGFYDKTPCHRLTTSGIYVLQCGDPTGTGTGGPGYTIPDEAKGSENYPAGTIAMARTQAANSGGSQFFIVYKDSPNLKQNLGTKQYTVFGTVSSGLSVVDKVAAAGSDDSNGQGDGKPKLATEIDSMTIPKAGASTATPSAPATK